MAAASLDSGCVVSDESASVPKKSLSMEDVKSNPFLRKLLIKAAKHMKKKGEEKYID
jgi:hypothetical protein